MIRVPKHPEYFWCPEQEQLWSTKTSIPYYPLRRNYGSEWNEYRDSFQVTESGVRHILTLDYLKTLKAKENMSAIENSFTSNPLNYKGKFLIGSINKATGAFSMTNNPARQPTREAAKNEAARLAKIDAGKMFVVLSVQDIASFQDVSWT